MSDPEVMLWSLLRGRDDGRPRFRRQHPIGSIILDFYCPAARLAVEVDGATHWDDAAQAKDEARDHWLRQQGIEVLRLPASRIYADLDGAVAEILRSAEARLAPSTTGSSPGRRPGSAGGPPPATAPRWGR